jgi:hypothetical protein
LLLLPLILMRHVEHILELWVGFKESRIKALDDGVAVLREDRRRGLNDILRSLSQHVGCS